MKAIALNGYGGPGTLRLADLAEAGKLTVHVERVLPLAEAAEAWRLNARGHTRGKLVLSVAND
jgi:NADPH:quinone reductase-like Zn-dependent oxidoreductase